MVRGDHSCTKRAISFNAVLRPGDYSLDGGEFHGKKQATPPNELLLEEPGKVAAVIDDAARKSLEANARKPRIQRSKQMSSSDQRDVYGL
jgi:hypothetical protein